MVVVKKSLRQYFLRWHRRIGVLIALFLLVLAVTGLLLNHTDQLSLSDRSVTSDWWLSHYNIERPESVAYQVGQRWLSHLGGHYIYLDEREVAFCENTLIGAVQLPQMIVAACGDTLVLLTTKGEEIERIGSSAGLPVGLEGLGNDDNALLLLASAQWYRADLMSMQFTPYIGSAKPVGRQALPADIEQQLLLVFRGEDIHWERLLLDLHSGRLFGFSGVIWMDLVAFMLIWVAASGVWSWAVRLKRSS